MEREKVIKELDKLVDEVNPWKESPPLRCDIPYPLLCDALALLKERELPTELKQKMWNALYTEEDKFEKKYVGTKEHNSWFLIYRPWLQEGFDLAIKTIADWEGR